MIGFSQNENYKQLLIEIKNRIISARISASISVNKEHIELYWNIGSEIVKRQEEFGWGKSIVEVIAKDLQKEFTGVNGFSSRNLWNMRLFYLEYRDFPFLQQLVAEIPWGQNLIIMKIKDIPKREYYLLQTLAGQEMS